MTRTTSSNNSGNKRSKTLPRKRRVQFATNDEGCIETKVHKVERLEKMSLWISKKERNGIAQRIFTVVKDVQNQKKSYHKTMRNVYQTIQQHQQQNPSTHNDFLLPKSMAQQLVYWMYREDDRRGLEKITMMDVGKARQESRREVIQTVLQVQTLCRQQGLKPHEAMPMLQLASEGKSACARRYGSILGMADALAARLQDVASSKANNVVQ